MPDVQAQVLGVEGQQGPRGTRYVVKLSAGVTKPDGFVEMEPSTFKQEIANKAYALIGQLCDVRIDIAPSKKEANRWFANLADIAAVGQLAAAPLQAGVQIPMAGTFSPNATGTNAVQIPMASASSTSYQRRREPEEEQRISRQWALGTAFEAVSVLYTGAGPDAYEEMKAKGIELGRELYKIAYTGETPEPIAPGTIIPTADTPEEVAAQVNEVMEGAVSIGEPEGGW